MKNFTFLFKRVIENGKSELGGARLRRGPLDDLVLFQTLRIKLLHGEQKLAVASVSQEGVREYGK